MLYNLQSRKRFVSWHHCGWHPSMSVEREILGCLRFGSLSIWCVVHAAFAVTDTFKTSPSEWQFLIELLHAGEARKRSKKIKQNKNGNTHARTHARTHTHTHTHTNHVFGVLPPFFDVVQMAKSFSTSEDRISALTISAKETRECQV